MKFFCCIFVALLSLSQPNICLAVAPQKNPSNDLALEVFQMSQSLDELTHFLKNQQSKNDEFQKLQASISYLSFRSRSIEMQEYELRFKKERRDGTERAIERTNMELEELNKDKRALQTNMPAVTPKNTISPESKLKMLQENFEELNTEIIKLENEIQASKDELASFEVYVQERLKLIH